jgi:hypothetical protein
MIWELARWGCCVNKDGREQIKRSGNGKDRIYKVSGDTLGGDSFGRCNEPSSVRVLGEAI